MADPSTVIARLRADPLRHIVPLKMLGMHPQHAALSLREDGSTWALRLAFPAGVSDYDRRTYPAAERVVLIDGNSVSLMRGLLDDLPNVELILKTNHAEITRRALELGGRVLRSLASFTSEQSAPSALDVVDVVDGTALDPELGEAFAQFGNDLSFLGPALQRGARWFAVRSGSEVRSACFVYQNFDSVWEIAGVLTRPEWRRRGLGARVVSVALRHLLMRDLQPRYQVDTSNIGSIALARGLGLVEFLRIDHISMPGRPPPAAA